MSIKQVYDLAHLEREAEVERVSAQARDMRAELATLADRWVADGAWLSEKDLRITRPSDGRLELENDRLILALSSSSDGLHVNLIGKPEALVFSSSGTAQTADEAERLAASFLVQWV